MAPALLMKICFFNLILGIVIIIISVTMVIINLVTTVIITISYEMVVGLWYDRAHNGAAG